MISNRIPWTAWMLLAMPGFGVIRDPLFTDFERPYKQALLHTSQRDREAALAALESARRAWDELLAGTFLTPPQAYLDEAGWEELAVSVSGRLAVGGLLVTNGEPAAAHGVLEAIREELRDLRESHGVHCLNDKLTAYHEVMEPAVLAAVRAPVGGATSELIDFERELIPELRSRWAAVEAFVAGSPEAARLEPLIAAERAAIDALAAALEETDGAAIVEAAAALKPAFAKVFLAVDEPLAG